MDFFPSKMNLPFESLPWMRALEQLRVSIFKGATVALKTLTRVRDKHQRLSICFARTAWIARSIVNIPETIVCGEENLTAETSFPFIGSIARSTTGPCPA